MHGFSLRVWQARLAASKAKNKPVERDVRLERGAHGDFGVSLEDLDGGVIVSFVQPGSEADEQRSVMEGDILVMLKWKAASKKETAAKVSASLSPSPSHPAVAVFFCAAPACFSPSHVPHAAPRRLHPSPHSRKAPSPASPRRTPRSAPLAT